MWRNSPSVDNVGTIHVCVAHKALRHTALIAPALPLTCRAMGLYQVGSTWLLLLACSSYLTDCFQGLNGKESINHQQGGLWLSVVQSKDSRARLPGFKSQLHPLFAVWSDGYLIFLCFSFLIWKMEEITELLA